MERYRDLTAEELLNEPSFRSWLNAPDAETNQLWNQFLLDYPEKKKTVLTARAMFKALRQGQAEPTARQGLLMWENILAQTEQGPPVRRRGGIVFNFAHISRLMAAASILVLIGIAGWLWVDTDLNGTADTYAEQTTGSDLPLIEQVNSGGVAREILLPDGSQVLLYPSGRLSYQARFAQGKRTVYLSGKARFHVVKDDKKPFLVYANDLVTQVVGTSFTINSPSARALATVRVESGKVKVFTLRNFKQNERGLEAEVAVLAPNQQVTYDPVKEILTKKIIAEPELLSQPQAFPNFDFNNTNVANVFNTLAQSYGVTIRYDANTIQDCSVTAPLGDEPLFRKLDIICQTIGATYEVWGTEIIVKGPGCGQ